MVKQKLIDQGVIIQDPKTVSVDSSINPDRIAPGVIIHNGCRLSGATTSIGPGSILGQEAPVTIQDCQLGQSTQLKGGFFSGATFLDGVTFSSGAHVRPGTLLEEQASCAHTVGLKQTILMPFVTLGSLINFCDCLMAGGSSPRLHSEVGSSYIHFNFTAHQDKATPSLIGDVPNGVMLNQSPVFLGGQGGLVGPTRLAFGTVIAAGTICRRDILQPDKLLMGQPKTRARTFNYDKRIYGSIDRICKNNLIYLGNLHALLNWYRNLRPLVTVGTLHAQACIEGAQHQLKIAIEERLKQLTQLAEKLELSVKATPTNLTENANTSHHRRFISQWPEIAEALSPTPRHMGELATRDAFLERVQKTASNNYIETIQTLPSDTKEQGSAWLQSIVDGVISQAEALTNG